MSLTIYVSITTPKGHEITAMITTLGGWGLEDTPNDWSCARVQIYQDGTWVGDGCWMNKLSDCSARLGANDGSETEAAYQALDLEIAAQLVR